MEPEFHIFLFEKLKYLTSLLNLFVKNNKELERGKNENEFSKIKN